MGSGMGFAWCCLFGSRTVFLKTPALDKNGVGMVTISGRVLLALILSLISTAFIFVLDLIDDVAKRGAPPGKSPGGEIISQIVFAKSILVGFSWEHSFDGGVECIAAKTSHPLCTQSLVAVFMWFAVVPAWRRHILRKALMLQDYYSKQTRAAMDRATGYHLYSQIPSDQVEPGSTPKASATKDDAQPLSAREMCRQAPEITA